MQMMLLRCEYYEEVAGLLAAVTTRKNHTTHVLRRLSMRAPERNVSAAGTAGAVGYFCWLFLFCFPVSCLKVDIILGMNGILAQDDKDGNQHNHTQPREERARMNQMKHPHTIVHKRNERMEAALARREVADARWSTKVRKKLRHWCNAKLKCPDHPLISRKHWNKRHKPFSKRCREITTAQYEYICIYIE
jgi:hypothetical protein